MKCILDLPPDTDAPIFPDPNQPREDITMTKRPLTVLGFILGMTTFAVVLVAMLTMLESVVQAETTEQPGHDAPAPEPEDDPYTCYPGSWSVWRLDGPCAALNPYLFDAGWADVRHESVLAAMRAVLRGDVLLADAVHVALLEAACNFGGGAFSHPDRTCTLPRPAPVTTTTAAPAGWPPPMCAMDGIGLESPEGMDMAMLCAYPVRRPSVESRLTTTMCISQSGYMDYRFLLWGGEGGNDLVCVRVPTITDWELPVETVCGPYGTAVWQQGRMYYCSG